MMETLFNLFYIYFRIGCVTTAGGYSMLKMITADMIAAGYLTLDKISDIIAIAEMTPGPFSINIATFTGVTVAGIPGGIFATIGVVVPCFIFSILTAKYILNKRENITMRSILDGMRPASVALILAATLMLAENTLFVNGALNFLITNIDFKAVIIAIIAFIAIYKYKVSPILGLLGSGILGMAIYMIK